MENHLLQYILEKYKICMCHVVSIFTFEVIFELLLKIYFILYISSSVQLSAALRVQEEFRTAHHFACLQEGRTAVRKRRVLMAEEAQAKTIVGAPI